MNSDRRIMRISIEIDQMADDDERDGPSMAFSIDDSACKLFLDMFEHIGRFNTSLSRGFSAVRDKAIEITSRTAEENDQHWAEIKAEQDRVKAESDRIANELESSEQTEGEDD